MDLQAFTLERFKKIYGKQTYQEISNMTGIQMTRVFRILNGQKMKLEEYEIFNELIDTRRSEKEKRLHKMFEQFCHTVHPNYWSELELFLKERNYLAEVINIANLK